MWLGAMRFWRAVRFEKESVMKKAVVWITLISFALSSSGCYSLFEGRNHSVGVDHAGEKQTSSFKEDITRVGEHIGRTCEHVGRVCEEVGKICLEIVIVATVIAWYFAAGAYGGGIHYNYNYHHY